MTILPCSSCGAAPALRNFRKSGKTYIACQMIGAICDDPTRIVVADSEEEAIAKWNELNADPVGDYGIDGK